MGAVFWVTTVTEPFAAGVVDVAVITWVVLAVVATVKLALAVPVASVSVGVAAKLPPFVLVHATLTPAVGIALPKASCSAAVSEIVAPWAGVSVEALTANVEGAAAATVMPALVPAVFVPSVTSLAVSVCVPAVRSSTENVPLPADSAASAGSTAAPSLELRWTTSLTAPATLKKASTACTCTSKAAPAVCDEGVPVLPLAVPGAAVSPGTSTCSFVKAPALTENAALVPFSAPPVRVAVRVAPAPACVSVTLQLASTPAVKVPVVASPADPARFDVTSTVAPAPSKLVTVLPFASCAVMRIENGVPAVCVPIAPPPAASTRKWSSAPAVNATAASPDVIALPAIVPLTVAVPVVVAAVRVAV